MRTHELDREATRPIARPGDHYRETENLGTYFARVHIAIGQAISSLHHDHDTIDDLGEGLFRLAVEAGADGPTALRIATDGTPRQRTLVRDDLLKRITRTRRPAITAPPGTKDRLPVDQQLAHWTDRNIASYVYAIQAGDNGPVKIGHSGDPLQRLAKLQTGNPEPLHLRAVIPGDKPTEDDLHQRFADARLIGEWFGGTDYLPIVLEYMAGLASTIIHTPPAALQHAQADTLALRREIERLWLEGHSTSQIAEWVHITTDELADHLAVMRRSTLYDIKRTRGNTTSRPTRHESLAERRTA